MSHDSVLIVNPKMNEILQHILVFAYLITLHNASQKSKVKTWNFNISVKIVLSKKGRPMILINGYTYSSTPGVSLKKRWKCSTHQSKGCLAALHTIGDQIVLLKDVHTHPPLERNHQNVEVKPNQTLT